MIAWSRSAKLPRARSLTSRCCCNINQPTFTLRAPVAKWSCQNQAMRSSSGSRPDVSSANKYRKGAWRCSRVLACSNVWGASTSGVWRTGRDRSSSPSIAACGSEYAPSSAPPLPTPIRRMTWLICSFLLAIPVSALIVGDGRSALDLFDLVAQGRRVRDGVSRQCAVRPSPVALLTTVWLTHVRRVCVRCCLCICDPPRLAG